MNETYAKECIVECIDNGKQVEAEVGRFEPLESLQVYMNTVKVNLKYNSKQSIYVGTQFGMEFVSEGPKLLGTYR